MNADGRRSRAERKMRVSTPPGSTAQPTPEETVAHVRELNERLMEYTKQADSVYLDTVERTLRALVDFQSTAAQTNDDQRVRTLANAYADFTREVTEAYVKAARELRK